MADTECEHDRTDMNVTGNTRRCPDCGIEFIFCEQCSDPTAMRGVFHTAPACPKPTEKT